MSGWGALAGAGMAGGVLLVALAVLSARRPGLAVRVLPYLRDLPHATIGPATTTGPGVVRSVFGPSLARAGDLVEQVLGGTASVRRRLARAGIDRTVHEFRVQQVVWGLCSFGIAAAFSVAKSLREPTDAVGLLVLCAAAFGFGVILCDNRLSARVKARERQMLLEFPVVAELLALAVVAGEGPVAALDRVVRRTRGTLAQELAAVLADVRTGVPVSTAFDTLAARTGVAVVSRFAEAIAIAIDRGTPLADVLHAQAGDVREASRRALIETGARKEVLMMVPVVFLVLPIVILFAFWPGAVGLSMVVR